MKYSKFLKYMVYLNQFLHTNTFEHDRETGMQNGNKSSPRMFLQSLVTVLHIENPLSYEKKTST